MGADIVGCGEYCNEPLSTGFQQFETERSLENVVSHFANTPVTGAYSPITLSSPRLNDSIIIHSIPDPNDQP